jgi:cell division protein ZapA
MALVDITINGRVYQVACDDGKEQHLAKLGSYLDKRVGELAGTLGQIGEARLLVMAGLLVADELADAQSSAVDLKRRAGIMAPEAEAALASGIDALAARIERIAAGLEAA